MDSEAASLVFTEPSPAEHALARGLEVARASARLLDKCGQTLFEAQLPDVLAEADSLWHALVGLQRCLTDSEMRKRLADTHAEVVGYAGVSAPSYVEAIYRAGERQYMTVAMLCRHGVLFNYLSRLHPSQSDKLSEPWPKLPKVEDIEWHKADGTRLNSAAHLLSRICREVTALPAGDSTFDCEQARAFLEKEIAAAGELTPNEARAKFCFEEWQSGKSYKQINAALKRDSGWEYFEDDKSVRGPINTWGKRIGVKPRDGQPGRQSKSA
jgi:hypothetical protein